MEGMESTSNVTPDTASESGSEDQGQDNESHSVDLQDTLKEVSGGGKAAPTKAEKAKIKAQVRELGDADMDALVTVKVNGQAKKMTVREAIKVSQLEQASHQKMQQAAQMQRQFQEFARQAKENPDLFFQQFGLDADAYSESRLAKKLEHMSMSPEQKKALEMEEKLKRYEDQEKKQKEAEETEKRTREEAKIQTQLDQEITDAFKDAGLPKDPFYVQLMAAQMLSAQRQGQDLSAKEAAGLVKTRFATHVNSILKAMDAPAILSFLGDDVRKSIREAELRRVTDKAPTNIDSATSKPGHSLTAASTAKAPRKPLTEREWREWVKTR